MRVTYGRLYSQWYMLLLKRIASEYGIASLIFFSLWHSVSVPTLAGVAIMVSPKMMCHPILTNTERVFSILIGPLTNIPFSGFKIVFWIAAALILMSLFIAIYVGLSFHRSDFHVVWPIKVLRGVVNVLVSVGFIPITAILLTPLKIDSSGFLSRFVSEGIVGWSSITTIYGITGVILLTFFVPFCLLMGLLNFEFGSNTKDIMARHSSRLDFVYLIVKAILIFVTDLAADQIVLRIFLFFSLSLALVCMLLLIVPYYNPKMNYMRASLLGSLAGAAISTAMRVFIPYLWNLELSMALILHIVTAIGFGVLCFLAMRLRIRKHLSTTSDSVYRLIAAGRKGGSMDASPTPEPVRMNQLNSRSPSNSRRIKSTVRRGSRMGPAGALSVQTASTGGDTVAMKPILRYWIIRSIYHYYVSATCQLKTMFLIKNSEKDSIEVAETIFQHNIRRHSESVFMHILYCNFLLCHKKDWIAATTQLRRIKTMGPSFDMLWLTYVLQKQVEREMKSARVGTSKTMGLMAYVDFQHNFGLARKYHAQTLRKIRSFWEILLQDNGALNKMGVAHLVAVHTENLASQAYSRVLNRFPESPLLWRAYGQYMAEVHNDISGANSAYQLAEELEEKQVKAHTSMFGSRSLGEPSDGELEPRSLGNVGRSKSNDSASDLSAAASDNGSDQNSRHESQLTSSQNADMKRTGEGTRHHILTRMIMKFNITFVFLVLILIGNYVAISVLANSRTVSTVTAIDLRLAVLDAGIETCELALMYYLNDTQWYDQSKLTWTLSRGCDETGHHVMIKLNEVESLFNKLYTSAGTNAVLATYFSTNFVKTTTYDPLPTVKKMTIAAAVQEFVSHTRRTIKWLTKSHHIMGSMLENSGDLKYVLRASYVDIPEMTSQMLQRYQSAYEGATTTLNMVLVIEGIVAVLVLLVIELVVFVPSFKAFHHEKHIRFSLLSLVSKYHISKQVEKYNEYEQNMAKTGDDASVVATVRTKAKVNQPVKYSKNTRFKNDNVRQERFINDLAYARDKLCKEFRPLYLKIAFTMLVVAMLVAIQIIYITVSFSGDIELMHRVTGTRSLEHAFGGLLMSSYFTVEKAQGIAIGILDRSWNEQFELNLQAYQQWFHGLMYGNITAGFGPVAPFLTPAREALRNNVLLPESSKVIQAFNDLIHYNVSDNTFMRPEFGIMIPEWRSPGTLKLAMRNDSQLYQTELVAKEASVIALNDYWLGLLVTTMIVYYVFIFRGITRHLDDDSSNTTRLLWTLPVETINTVLPLKKFLSDPQAYMAHLINIHEQKKLNNDMEIIKQCDWAERVMDSNSIASAVLSHENKIMYATMHMGQLFKVDVNSMIGISISNLVPHIHQAEFLESIRSFKAQSRRRMELKIQGMKRDGSTFPMIARLHRIDMQRGPLKARTSLVVEFQAHGHGDTTITMSDVKQSAHASQKDALIDVGHDLWDMFWTHSPAVIVSMAGMIEASNQSAVDILGKDVVGRTLQSFLGPHSEQWSNITDACGAANRSTYHVKCNLLVGARRLNVRLMIKTVSVGESSEFRKAFVVIEDLTEKTNLEQWAVRIEQERDAILQSTDNAIVGLDLKDEILFISDEIENMLAHRRLDIIGKSISTLFVSGGESWERCKADESKEHRVLLRKPDGIVVPLMLRVRCMNENGVVTTICCFTLCTSSSPVPESRSLIPSMDRIIPTNHPMQAPQASDSDSDDYALTYDDGDDMDFYAI